MMIIIDQPAHTQLRKLVNQSFNRRTIDGLDPLVTDSVRRYLDDLEGREEFDIVADFGVLFPVEVISAILGVPEPERKQVRHWVDSFLLREVGNPNTRQGLPRRTWSEHGATLIDVYELR